MHLVVFLYGLIFITNSTVSASKYRFAQGTHIAKYLPHVPVRPLAYRRDFKNHRAPNNQCYIRNNLPVFTSWRL